MECHLMTVDKRSKRIMNPISKFGKAGALNVEIGGSDEQAKIDFPVTIVTACRAKSKNYLDRNYLVLIFKLKPRMSNFWKN